MEAERQEQNETWPFSEVYHPQMASRYPYVGYEETLHSLSSSRARNSPAPGINPTESALYLSAPTHEPASSVTVICMYACPQCPETFRKAMSGGELNLSLCSFAQLTLNSKHPNRKHLRRYQCPISGCGKKFGMHGSLERHIRSCHSFAAGVEGLRCPNSDCKSPEKVFARRDNLERHVKRCESTAKE
jgi:hypothetical protein